MSGLGGLQLGANANLAGRGGVNARVGGGMAQGAGPASAGAFGQGASTTAVAGTSLSPADPVGMALTTAVAATVGLAFVRHSLPSNMKRVFDLTLIEIILAHHAWGLVRLESRRWAATGGPILSRIGGAGNVIFGT